MPLVHCAGRSGQQATAEFEFWVHAVAAGRGVLELLAGTSITPICAFPSNYWRIYQVQNDSADCNQLRDLAKRTITMAGDNEQRR